MDGLVGKRILVAEDEYFIAFDLKRALQRAGADVLGPVARLSEGLAIVATQRPDAGLLDISLGKALSYELADKLAAQGVPFLFLTGYDDWSMPENYRSVTRLTKPCPSNVVLDALGEIMRPEVSP